MNSYKKPIIRRKRKIYYTVDHGYSLRSMSKHPSSETFEFLEDIQNEGCNSTEVQQQSVAENMNISEPGSSNIQAPREAMFEAASIPDLPEFLVSLQKAQPGTSAIVRRFSRAMSIQDVEVRANFIEINSVFKSFDKSNLPKISGEF